MRVDIVSMAAPVEALVPYVDYRHVKYPMTISQQFRNLQFTGCVSIRRKCPAAINWLNQKFLSHRCGFWIVIKGTK